MDSNTPTGKQFDEWWNVMSASLSTADAKATARAAWDAAVFTAGMIVNSRKCAVLGDKKVNYELAAHLRDCCDAVTSALTEKNLLKEGEKARWQLKQIEWHREKYRKLPAERLLELPALPEGCEAAIALADVKRERVGAS